MKDVLYIPDFRYNILSVSKITKELQRSVQFSPDYFVFQDLSSGEVLEIGEEKGCLYLMNHKKEWSLPRINWTSFFVTKGWVIPL